MSALLITHTFNTRIQTNDIRKFLGTSFVDVELVKQKYKAPSFLLPHKHDMREAHQSP